MHITQSLQSGANSRSRFASVGSLWKRWITPRTTNPDDAFRERTVRGMVPILGFLVVTGTFFLIVTGQAGILPMFAGMAIVIAATAIAITYHKLNLAALLMFLFPVMAAVGSLASSGYLSPAGLIMSYLSVLFGAILLSPRIRPLLPVGMIIVYGFMAFHVGAHGPIPDPTDTTSAGPMAQTVEMAILSTLFFGIGYYLLAEFEQRRQRLAQLVDTLEERVAERTRDLTVAANVAQEVSQILNQDALLPELAQLINDGFNLAHVSIYSYDADHSTLHLQASANHKASAISPNGHKVEFGLNEDNLIALAARERQPRVATDTVAANGQAALPMTFGQRLIGVLELRSDNVDHFNVDEIKVLTILAQQTAVAIRNAQLFAETSDARQNAERANHVKSAFLASMSHELRTPLNAIINFTKFVVKGTMGPVNDEQSESLNQVIDSGKHLLNLINDVLDMSKIEAGSLNLFVESHVDVNEILASVTATGKSLLAGKNVELQTQVQDGLPAIVGDRLRIVQILLNILSNACKFTSEGSVKIQASSNANEIVIAISDTGPGIALQDQALVFEAFKQTTTGLRQGSGTGLGMPISKSLAEAHGGRLWLTSEVGIGSTFYIALPIKSEILVPTIVN